MKRAFLLPRSLAIPPCGFTELIAALHPHVEASEWETGLVANPVLPVGYEIGSEIARLRSEAAATGVSRITLFGEGDGAGIALAYAMSYPETIDALVLFDPVLVGPTALAQFESRMREDLMAVLDQSPSDLLEVYVRQSVREEIADDIVLHLARALPRTPARAVDRYRASILALARYSADYSVLYDVDGAVFVGVGEDAHPRLQEHARLLSQLFPEGRFKSYPWTHPFRPSYCAMPERVANDILECWGAARD